MWVKSVGIDIGTSTTKIITSRLKISNRSISFGIPNYKIVDRIIDYQSPIYFTPLTADNKIDEIALLKIIDKEYYSAGLNAKAVDTGAVIITGESATRENASAVLHLLAERAGDFVVATAGPDLEAVIAGKGSGACTYSTRTNKIVANVDIGGGTANIAYFHAGKIIDTFTLQIGGRLITVDNAGYVQQISAPVQYVIARLNLNIKTGQRTNLDELKKLTDYWALELFNYLQKKHVISNDILLLGKPPRNNISADSVMFSGGVGYLFYNAKSPGNFNCLSTYNDIGPLLAASLRKQQNYHPLRIVSSSQTNRATVIGAGIQTVQISGSTIYVESDVLPLRNLPVMRVEIRSEKDIQDSLSKAIELGQRLYAIGDNSSRFALVLPSFTSWGFDHIQKLARVIVESFDRFSPLSNPLVIVTENDSAKVLGHAIKFFDKKRREIISLDQVNVREGDYIDIGKPLPSGIIPLVIKTLSL